MKIKHIASSLMFVGAAVAGDASAKAVLTSPPVSVNAPSPDVNRVVWCQAQSLASSKSSNVVSALIVGDDGQPVLGQSEISGTVGPAKTIWLAGATGGSGTLYCRFTVADKKKVRGYIVVQDEPKAFAGANPSYKHTVMSLEAK